MRLTTALPAARGGWSRSSHPREFSCRPTRLRPNEGFSSVLLSASASGRAADRAPPRDRATGEVDRTAAVDRRGLRVISPSAGPRREPRPADCLGRNRDVTAKTLQIADVMSSWYLNPATSECCLQGLLAACCAWKPMTWSACASSAAGSSADARPPASSKSLASLRCSGFEKHASLARRPIDDCAAYERATLCDVGCSHNNVDRWTSR